MKNFRLLCSAAVLLGSMSAAPAVAAELVMLERHGCSWCLRWNREIAPAYPKTAEGRLAPLRRVDVTEPWPDDLADVAGDIYTPTFIVIENGAEVARLRGYPGEHFFWPLLNEMLDQLPAPAPAAPGPAAPGPAAPGPAAPGPAADG